MAKTPKPKATKEKLPQVTMGNNLKNYLRLLTVMGPLKALEAQLKTSLEDEAVTRMIKEGHSTHERPTNFVGVCEKGDVEFQLQKRSISSPLTAEEVKFLTENNVPYENATVTPKSIQINPAVMKDEELVKIIEKAIANSPAAEKKMKDLGINSSEVFFYNEEVTKPVVTEETLNEAFKRIDLQTMTNLVTLTTKFISKPNPNAENDYDEALNVLMETGVGSKKKV